MRAGIVVLVACLFAASARGDEDEKLGIAVLNPQTSGDIAADIAPVLAGLMSTKLDRAGVFRVVTEDDVKQMVSFDQMKSALSCDEQASCLAEIGQALGVPYMLTGAIAKLGDSFVVNLALVDITAAKVQKRESATYADMNALTRGLDAQVERTVQALLYREKGKLLVLASEEGATVEIDGVAIGTTPLGEQRVASGPHRISVSKEGFIQFAQDLIIQPKLQSTLDARLHPSPQFLNEYKARTGATRTLAWSTTIGSAALGAVGAGLFGGSFLWIDAFRRERGAVDDTPVVATSAEVAPIVATQITGIVLLGLAPVVGGASAFFWATGDDPERYDAIAAQPSTTAGGR